MKSKLLITILLLIGCNLTFAQSTTEEIIDKFFKIYRDSPVEAVDYIFSTNSWMMERNQDGIENVKMQMSSFLKLVGEYYGQEKITENRVGDSYKFISYLGKYDRQPVRFTFIFYKPQEKWQVQSFLYDDNLDDELKEAGKVYRLKESW